MGMSPEESADVIKYVSNPEIIKEMTLEELSVYTKAVNDFVEALKPIYIAHKFDNSESFVIKL